MHTVIAHDYRTFHVYLFLSVGVHLQGVDPDGRVKTLSHIEINTFFKTIIIISHVKKEMYSLAQEYP